MIRSLLLLVLPVFTATDTTTHLSWDLVVRPGHELALRLLTIAMPWAPSQQHMTPPSVLGTWVMLSLTPLMVRMALGRMSLVLLHLVLLNLEAIELSFLLANLSNLLLQTNLQ